MPACCITRKEQQAFLGGIAVLVQVPNVCVHSLVFMVVALYQWVGSLHTLSTPASWTKWLIVLWTWQLLIAALIQEVAHCCSNTSHRAGRTGQSACPSLQRMGGTHQVSLIIFWIVEDLGDGIRASWKLFTLGPKGKVYHLSKSLLLTDTENQPTLALDDCIVLSLSRAGGCHVQDVYFALGQ